MPTTITRPRDPIPLSAATGARAQAYLANARSFNTRRAYHSDWVHFALYCLKRDLVQMPASPRTLARYITDLAETHKVSTIQRRLAAISQAHALEGHPSPTEDPRLRELWKGIRRTKGAAPDQKHAVTTDILRTMLAHFPPDTLQGIRDRALLLLGFAGAFRRTELVGLDVADLEFTGEGLIVRLRTSKTDQEGQGSRKGIPYGKHEDTCPVRAVRAWLDRSGLTQGALFRPIVLQGGYRSRSGHAGSQRLRSQAVARLVKRGAKAAGLDESLFSGHSLRAGFATSAAAAGVEEARIMAQTGHKSVAMVRRYYRDGSLFVKNAAAGVGL